MLKPKKEGDQLVLVNDDGSKTIPLTEKVWDVLGDPDILMDAFKRALQSYTLETNPEWAQILKEECPQETDYRALRVSIRTSGL